MKKITIIGAGPVGTLLGMTLSTRNYQVEVYEKMNDPRTSKSFSGRSINLALSQRGIHALKKIGIEQQILENAVPMNGRMIHHLEGTIHFQPYGQEGQFINSVSRAELNKNLIELAEKKFGVEFHFNQKCTSVDFMSNKLIFEGKNKSVAAYEILAATDGAHSIIRKEVNRQTGTVAQIETLAHGYKELSIPASKNGNYQLEKNALHIWPRESFMFIALPNFDGSFTCTLFLPLKGEISFESLNTPNKLINFFEIYFNDALPLIDNLVEDYFKNEASSLSTVHTFPWVHNNVFLLGDAAHAMVPFYGQGMNAGFEDVRILNEILAKNNDSWDNALIDFEKNRKPNTDAISELALQNFIEMRDLVDDKDFQIRKNIEAKLHATYSSFIPLYSMVTFSDIPYAEALIESKKMDSMFLKIFELPNVRESWETPPLWEQIIKIFQEYLLR